MLVVWTLFSAVRTIVLPRSAPDHLTRIVFVGVRRSILAFPLHWARSYEQVDRILAFYAPISLLALLFTWLALVLLGYTGMFWGAGASSWYDALVSSGSSLLTLGFAAVEGLSQTLLTFTEAAVGLIDRKSVV